MKDKLKEWLDKQGYPLEMRVAKLLIEKGFSVRHSPYYLDKDTETRREIDIIASAVLNKDNNSLKFTFVIECKNNNDKPWISFCSKRHQLHPRAYITQKCATKSAHDLLNGVSNLDFNFEEGFIFKHPERPAYNITQAFDSGSDKTYGAMYSTSKACQSIMKTHYDRYGYNEIIIPMVVIGGKLFESYLSEEGEFEVEEVERSTVIWNNPIVGMPNTTLFIETYNNLNNRIEIYKKEIKEFFKLCEGLFPRYHH